MTKQEIVDLINKFLAKRIGEVVCESTKLSTNVLQGSIQVALNKFKCTDKNSKLSIEMLFDIYHEIDRQKNTFLLTRGGDNQEWTNLFKTLQNSLSLHIMLSNPEDFIERDKKSRVASEKQLHDTRAIHAVSPVHQVYFVYPKVTFNYLEKPSKDSKKFDMEDVRQFFKDHSGFDTYDSSGIFSKWKYKDTGGLHPGKRKLQEFLAELEKYCSDDTGGKKLLNEIAAKMLVAFILSPPIPKLKKNQQQLLKAASKIGLAQDMIDLAGSDPKILGLLKIIRLDEAEETISYHTKGNKEATKKLMQCLKPDYDADRDASNILTVAQVARLDKLIDTLTQPESRADVSVTK